MSSIQLRGIVGGVLFVSVLHACAAANEAAEKEPYRTEPRTVELGTLPDQPEILFTSMRWNPRRAGFDTWEVYASDRNGRNASRLTFLGSGPGVLHAALSPDHRLLAAVTGQVQPEKFLVFDLENKREWQLVPHFAWAAIGGMDWSPDGYLYFVGDTRPKRLDVYKIRPDGTDLVRLTNTKEVETDVSISDDGSLVAFVRLVARSGRAKPQIWVMNADGSDQRMVYDGGPEVGVHGNIPIGAMDPELSPDNRRLVFARTNTKYDNYGFGSYDICVINIDGTGLRVLTEGTRSINAVPDWNEQGLLYSEIDEKGDYVGLVRMNPDDGRPQRLEEGLDDFWDGGRHAKWIPPLDPAFRAAVPPLSGTRQAAEPPAPADDGTPRARGAREETGSVAYEAAKFGTGALSDKAGDLVTYPTDGNILRKRGTVELWIRVRDSLDDGLEWNPLFVVQQEPYQPLRALLLQLIRDSRVLVFVAGDMKDNSVVKPIEWRKGEDHYLAATWGESGMTLYVDGEVAATSPRAPGLTNLPERMSVGGYLWQAAKHPSNTIIDELRVSSVERSADEIRTVYGSNAPFAEDDRTLLLDHFSPVR